MYPLRIAQISDLHFATPNLSPFQLFSKRWLGNLNAVFSRKKIFCHERLKQLADLFKESKVSHLIVTGDVSTTSHPKEFALASQFLSSITDRSVILHVLPGNHDNYTKKSFTKKTFHRFFNSSLKDNGVDVSFLGDGFWLITLDTTLATSLVSSHGYFSPNVETHLKLALANIPQGDRVILANHFPFFANENPRKILKRGEALRTLLINSPQIVLYLHGHTHMHCIADLRSSGFPIVLDCGSTPHKSRGTCHLIEIENNRFTIKVYRFLDSWQISQEVVFNV